MDYKSWKKIPIGNRDAPTKSGAMRDQMLGLLNLWRLSLISKT
jgi:hypothetical protein